MSNLDVCHAFNHSSSNGADNGFVKLSEPRYHLKTSLESSFPAKSDLVQASAVHVLHADSNLRPLVLIASVKSDHSFVITVFEDIQLEQDLFEHFLVRVFFTRFKLSSCSSVGSTGCLVRVM